MIAGAGCEVWEGTRGGKGFVVGVWRGEGGLRVMGGGWVAEVKRGGMEGGGCVE